LVAAMLVTPGATAYLLTRRLSNMLLVSGLSGAVASIAGLYLSYYLNIASGAAIVLSATFLFILAYLFAPEKGLVHQRRRLSTI
jgi:ABC-type Mn2+/Zn2+ transport system permease subunit